MGPVNDTSEEPLRNRVATSNVNLPGFGRRSGRLRRERPSPGDALYTR